MFSQDTTVFGTFETLGRCTFACMNEVEDEIEYLPRNPSKVTLCVDWLQWLHSKSLYTFPFPQNGVSFLSLRRATSDWYISIKNEASAMPASLRLSPHISAPSLWCPEAFHSRYRVPVLRASSLWQPRSLTQMQVRRILANNDSGTAWSHHRLLLVPGEN